MAKELLPDANLDSVPPFLFGRNLADDQIPIRSTSEEPIHFGELQEPCHVICPEKAAWKT